MVCAASERETDGGVEEAAVAYSGRMGIGIAVAEADEERRFWLFDERIDAERDVIVGVFPVGVANGASHLEYGFADVKFVVAEPVGQTAAQSDAFKRCVVEVGVDVFDAGRRLRRPPMPNVRSRASDWNFIPRVWSDFVMLRSKPIRRLCHLPDRFRQPLVCVS